MNMEFGDPLEVKFDVDLDSPSVKTKTDAKPEFKMTSTNGLQIVHYHNSEELIFPNCLSSPKHEIETEVDPLATDSEEFTSDPVEILTPSSHGTEEQKEIKRTKKKKAKSKTPDSGKSSSFSLINNLPLQNFEGEKSGNQNSNKNKNDKKNSSCFEATFSHDQRSVKDAGIQSLSLPFTCFECLQKFPTKPALKSHIDESHATVINNINIRSSKKKSKSNQSSEASAAMAISVTFECRANGCKQVFFSPSALDLHTRSHKIGPGVYFTCSLCPETFPSARFLKQHMFLHANVTPFNCSLCSLYFKNPIRLKNHLQSAIHNEDSSERGKVIETLEVVCENDEEEEADEEEEEDERDPLEIPATNNSSSRERRFKCDSCDMAYVFRKDLMRHIESRSKEGPLKCTRCPEHFCTVHLWVKHFTWKHRGNPYECVQPGCYTSFRRAYQLKSHILKFHSGVKPTLSVRQARPYKCSVDLCGQLFRQFQELKEHYKEAHPSFNLCQEPGCTQIFDRKLPLKEHLAKVHKVRRTVAHFKSQALKKLLCPSASCGQFFLSKLEREEHVKAFHRGMETFECVECKTFYKYALGLQVHLEEYHGKARKTGQDMETETGFNLSEVSESLCPKPGVKIKQEVETGAGLESASRIEIKSEVLDEDLGKCQGEKEVEENCGIMETNILIKQEDIKVTPDVNFFLS